jgi:AraC-like DNA-binding protein
MLTAGSGFVLTNHATVTQYSALGGIIVDTVYVRITGQFTQILQLWMRDRDIACAALQARLAEQAQRATLPVAQWKALLAEAAALSSDSGVGLQIGAQATLRHVGVLGYLVINCETLWEALETYQLCERRFYGVSFARLVRSRDHCAISWPDRLGEENSLFVQVALATLVTFLRQRFPSGLQLVEVALSERQPQDPAPYLTFFGCPVRFGSNNPGITLDAVAASQCEIGILPPAVRAVRDQQSAAFGSVVAASDPFLRRLQSALLKLMPEGRVSLARVAGEMGCSSRTLQRRLGHYQLSYQSLLDAVREQLGCRYLRESQLTYLETAALLGFTEQSAFNRAFKQWTGMTPGNYRHSSSTANGIGRLCPCGGGR